MKRVTFAYIEFHYDFDTREEANKYIKKITAPGSNIFFVDQRENKPYWTVIVRKPYRDYNPGW